MSSELGVLRARAGNAASRADGVPARYGCPQWGSFVPMKGGIGPRTRQPAEAMTARFTWSTSAGKILLRSCSSRHVTGDRRRWGAGVNKEQIVRRSLRHLIALLVLLGVGTGFVSPASASGSMRKTTPPGPCSYWNDSTTGETASICIFKNVNDQTVNGYLYYGHAHNERRSVTGTLYVQECQAINNTAQNCSTIAANGKTADTNTANDWQVATSRKHASYGWIYRTCASLSVEQTEFEFINSCGPFVTGNFDQNIYQDLLVPKEPIISG
jgi:hypothetical protein